MTDRELERRLEAAVSHAAPHDFNAVLSHCEARKGNVIFMAKQNHSHILRKLAAACLALILIGGGLFSYQQANAVASVVSIDVNPSVELTVNRKGRILSCTPLNEEALVVLADMGEGADLKGAALKVGVNAIVGALLRHGYLDSISSAILLYVEDKDAQRAERIQAELTGVVDAILTEQAAQAAVLSQTAAQEPSLNTTLRENHLSAGKANLVGQVLELTGADATDRDAALGQLSALSIEELYDLMTTQETRIPIGKARALVVVEAYVGTQALSSVSAEVDAELNETPAHYEVELTTAFGEFDYIVDAFTGEILRGERDILSQTTAAPAEPLSPAAEALPATPTPSVSAAPAIPAPSTPAVSDIGSARAKAIALEHAGLDESEVKRLTTERDYDDGRLEYEVEFFAGGAEYDYTIDAGSGRILEYDREFDD